MVLTSSIKFLNFFAKRGKSFLTTEGCLGKAGGYTVTLGKNGELSQLSKALIGDTSLSIERTLGRSFTSAFDDVQYMFLDSKSMCKIYGRPKSALSTTTKLERNAIKKGGFTNFQDALECIGDGIGTRGIMESLPKLTKTQIAEQITQTTFKGKPLTNRQVELLEKYIYERPIDAKHQEEAYQLFKEFAKPLVERHSQEAVNELTMGVLAKRLGEGEGKITLQQIKNEGLLDPSLIKEFEQRLQSQDIVPIVIKDINNYRGAHGLPYFTDSQMAQLNYARGISSKSGAIVTRNAATSRYGYIQESSSLEQAGYQYIEPPKSIKASGYNTCQMNIEHTNGALGEIQFKGRHIDEFGEYEHIAYDLRQGKNTLGEVFDEYASVVSKLPDSQYQIYNKYLESCYNYCHRLELGLPAKKPVLPKSLNPILSMESMKSLHDKGELVKQAEAVGFKPYYEAIA